ncbi:hydroxyacylglutathione hydrolase [Celerinatantimonas diazotrophica]|uniref:Hydroxyacylglutathione hydrolase n=1 Tax=Celerinatantimonas diazotrophica TaxID=412034 RepID=A0A4R1K3Q4_9GAMM|nr:hydroxyacylglutathione hydrolase [Celerinatantimonas diazotrophica]TCK58728.1 hydroxyacylglutathione hydrolase [Celerinatantimonas diazotrophica]CAG9297359.1 Hydroxyacylglutathione hydrolase GloB [Celerinatantimonas diazotrophica]
MQVITIPAFDDNYIWLLHQPNETACAVVDPGEAGPVIERLQALDLQLKYILLTHHHMDHIGGVKKLKAYAPECQVIAGANIKLPFNATRVNDGDVVSLDELNCSLKVMATPGHTISHVVYYTDEMLFCGDTLFNCGCGRLFEGSVEQMLESLSNIAKLNSETQVYAAHEYTMANLKFALTIEPHNPLLQQYQTNMLKQRAQGLPTVPFSLASQKKLNPFMRCHEISLQQALSHLLQINCSTEMTTFTQLRAYKDRF